MPSTVLPFPLRSVEAGPGPAPGGPPVLVLSTDGVVVGCSTAVSDLLGRPAADVLGARAEKVASGTAGALAAAAQGQEAGRCSVRLVGHDGRPSRQLTDWSVVRAAGATLQVVFTAGTGPGGDELLSATAARSRAIADTAEEGIWELGPDGRTRYANARMAALLGLPADPFDVDVLDRPLPHPAAGLRAHLATRLGQDPERYELAYAHPDQRERRSGSRRRRCGTTTGQRSPCSPWCPTSRTRDAPRSRCGPPRSTTA